MKSFLRLCADHLSKESEYNVITFNSARMKHAKASVTTKVIKIGNSQGIRIPKPLLEQCGLHAEVELVVEDDCLTIRPIEHPRKSWEKAFMEMTKNGDDKLLDEVTETEWDRTEWVW